MRHIKFYLDAIPVPQGSKKLMPKGGRKARRCVYCRRTDMIMVESADGKLRPYRAVLSAVAAGEMRKSRHTAPFSGGVSASIEFVYARPKYHFLKSGKLTKAAPAHKSSAPDMDKLERAWGDAMTKAKVWTDDAILVEVRKAKRWSRSPEDKPGVYVSIFEMDSCTT